MKLSITRTAIAAIVVLGGVASAHATPLSGGISMRGGFLPDIRTTSAATNLDAPSGFDFSPFTCLGHMCGDDGHDGRVPGQQHDRKRHGRGGHERNDQGPLVRDSGSGDSPVPAITKFETFAEIPGLTFDLTTIAVTSHNANALILSGSGVFQLGRFDNTPDPFAVTGNGAGATFSFSASQAAVPEPTSMMLFATGLAGIAARAWRKRRQ